MNASDQAEFFERVEELSQEWKARGGSPVAQWAAIYSGLRNKPDVIQMIRKIGGE